MNTMNKILLTALGALLVAGLAAAQEMDHSHMDHSQMDHSAYGASAGYTGGSSGSLAPVVAIPPSGEAREAGSDGRYGMEPTSADDGPAERCALGSRGIVMLDNAEWARCGGKPQGAARGPGYYPALPPWNEPGTGQTHRMDHSSMSH